ncbi:hypothetical protein [Roseinatronobacter thiooxidans]|nr:hypothetical protein [Roseinatronobacter thiooxidans]
MFSSIRKDAAPTIADASRFMVLISVLMRSYVEDLQRRSGRMRGLR